MHYGQQKNEGAGPDEQAHDYYLSPKASNRPGRYSSASKVDSLSDAVSNFSVSRRDNSSAVSRSFAGINDRPLIKTRTLAKNYRDVDSQADRYRDIIAEQQGLQMTAGGHNQTMTRFGEQYPAPYREGVFERNKKHDG